MSHPLTLHDGLLIGAVTHRDAVLRLPTAGDIIRAAREAEEVVAGPNGRPALVSSPSRLTFLLLGTQIVSIGDYTGPFGLEVLGKLSARDLELLQIGVELIDQAVGLELDALVAEAQARGRSAGAGG